METSKNMENTSSTDQTWLENPLMEVLIGKSLKNGACSIPCLIAGEYIMLEIQFDLFWEVIATLVMTLDRPDRLG